MARKQITASNEILVSLARISHELFIALSDRGAIIVCSVTGADIDNCELEVRDLKQSHEDMLGFESIILLDDVNNSNDALFLCTGAFTNFVITKVEHQKISELVVQEKRSVPAISDVDISYHAHDPLQNELYICAKSGIENSNESNVVCVRNGIGVEVVSELDFSDCIAVNGMWTLSNQPAHLNNNCARYDKFLALSFTGQTKFMNIGSEDITDVSGAVAFETSLPTLAIFCIAPHTYVQVTNNSVIIIQQNEDGSDGKQVCKWNSNSTISTCYISFYYVVLKCYHENTIHLLSISEKKYACYSLIII
jgi:hypothetical protein